MKNGRGLKRNLERLEVSGKEWAGCGASTWEEERAQGPGWCWWQGKGQAKRICFSWVLLWVCTCLLLVFFKDACWGSSHSVPPSGGDPLPPSVPKVQNISLRWRPVIKLLLIPGSPSLLAEIIPCSGVNADLAKSVFPLWVRRCSNQNCVYRILLGDPNLICIWMKFSVTALILLKCLYHMAPVSAH